MIFFLYRKDFVFLHLSSFLYALDKRFCKLIFPLCSMRISCSVFIASSFIRMLCSVICVFRSVVFITYIVFFVLS